MPPVLFLCDGVSTPAQWSMDEWKDVHQLRHRGLEPQVNLRIDNLSHRLLSQLQPREADLVRVASYVYVADQWVSRGGAADVNNKQWTREMAMVIPVEDPQFWNDPTISGLLSSVLNFLTDDLWRFSFCRREGDQEQLVFGLDKAQVHGNPDCVIAFSGGADSLCAAVEALANGNKPVLVSHTPAPNIGSRQHELVNTLRGRTTRWGLPYIGVKAHCRRTQARDTSQRSRAFLYTSNAACVASQLNVQDVLLADNGVVSLNLPINDQLIGALASRGTHPKFLRLFNAFIAKVLPTRVQIRNPFWNRTRAEVLEVLKKTRNEDLLQRTISCSRGRGRSTDSPQCGYCSQCIDRRFGVIIAGLEDYDLAELYGVDIFTDELLEGEQRVVATSYARFAAHVSSLEDDSFFADFSELYECVDHQRPDADKQAAELIAMVKRHGQGVISVLESQVHKHAQALSSRTLPEHCLLRLHVGPSGLKKATPSVAHQNDKAKAAPEFIHSPDYRSVTFRGEQFTLTTLQAAAVQQLHEAYRSRTPALGDQYILERIGAQNNRFSDIFKRSRVWNTLIVSGPKKGTHRLNLST